MTHPLVEEAVRKAAIAWIAVAGGPAYGLWCMPQDGALHVVVGPGEQNVPGLAEAATVLVILRGDHGGAIVEYEAEVARVLPGTDRWDAVVPALAGKRLNAPGPTEELVARWAHECAVLALTPASDPLPLDDDSGAAPPRPTPAANPTPKPFRLHRVRRPRSK
jgi:hypothetical protein